jgi:hypothetical protein
MVQEQQQQSVHISRGRTEVHTSTPHEQTTSKVCYKDLWAVRLSLSAKSASHSAVFFSHNKSANSTFSQANILDYRCTCQKSRNIAIVTNDIKLQLFWVPYIAFPILYSVTSSEFVNFEN